MLQNTRERLTLLLLALLPFHAFLVTAGTFTLSGGGHAPDAMLAIWKEILLVIICGIALVEVGLLWWNDQKHVLTLDTIDLLILVLFIVALFASMYAGSSLTAFIYGVKYDFLPLFTFLVLRRVGWTDEWKDRAIRTLVVTGAIIALYGLISSILPQRFFEAIGYSPLHSLYRPDAPLAAFHQLGGSSIRRIQSVMSGPNQLGIWLLIPWSIGLVSVLTSRGILPRLLEKLKGDKTSVYIRHGMHAGYLTLISLAVLLTFSRSAWIAFVFITFFAFWRLLPRKKFQQYAVRLIAPFLFLTVLLALFYPQVIIRAASSRDHFLRPMEAAYAIATEPFGRGLGSAGPASNRVSDNCVYLETGADASWASEHPDLCVFVGDKQVQPESPCNCPFLPENWYLQIGVETGVLGLVLFIALTLLILLKLLNDETFFTQATLFAFVGVGICALFLHAWEDSAIAYTLWLLIASSRRYVTPEENRSITT